MFRKMNLTSRRVMSLLTAFVLLISLSACNTAGNPTGGLKVDEDYVTAGNFKITNGELWDELRWSSKEILDEKIKEVILNDYIKEIEVVIKNNWVGLSDQDKEVFPEDFTKAKFESLKATYSQRIIDYVIADIYNFEFSSGDYYDSIEAVSEFDEKSLFLTYEDEIYSSFNISTINGKSIYDLCASKKDTDYLTLAKNLPSLYYPAYAQELLAYEKLDEDIKEAWDERDTEDEDDLGYFTKEQYTTAYKDNYANQGDLNLILINFASKDEFESTLRSFGLKIYKEQLVYIAKPEGKTFSEYCTYYEDATSVDGAYLNLEDSFGEVVILELYIQIYNYLYGGYRDMLYTDAYASAFDSIDLTSVTESIIKKYRDTITSDEARKAEFDSIVATLNANENVYDFNTIYTREYISNIAASLPTYLYETLCLPFAELEDDDDSKCYSTELKTYDNRNWIAFKLGQESDKYDVYTKGITNDELYENIAANKDLVAVLEGHLKQEAITTSKISAAINDEILEVSVKIYDEALEIAYATENADYSKTYGKAPNNNVIATITYNNKTWNLNIVEDTTDENAVSGGVYTTLERELGTTTAVDLLSRKVVKATKAYEDTAERLDDYYEQVEYVLAAFANNSFATSGYSSTIGKYNFMMLYFHTANVDKIVSDQYRVSEASAKLLTNYNSNTLLGFFQDYADSIYDNYFSITGKRLVVYIDADDNNEHDDVTKWTDTQKNLAKELVLDILKKVSSLNDSHSTALTNIVSEINGSARAKFEDNPIAPENEWAKYRKVGLNVALEDVTATNSTTNIDFKLKQRLFDIYNSNDYSINDTAPTEYIEDLNDYNDILETKDGYNLLLVTSAEFKTTAEFDEEDDQLGLYENVDVYYNDEYVTVSNLYNDNEKLTLDQIRLYVLEYVSLGTSNLSPSAIAKATSSFLSPVLTRYTSTETQRDIILHFIEKYTKGEITFASEHNNTRLENIININHESADGYLSIYADDTTGTLNTYSNWWTDIQNIVSEILLSEGENK